MDNEISQELEDLNNKLHLGLDFEAILKTIGTKHSSYDIVYHLSSFKTKFSRFKIVACQTYFHDHDGQADSSYTASAYTLYYEQWINGIQMNSVVQVEKTENKREGSGKDWYYDTETIWREFKLKDLL